VRDSFLLLFLFWALLVPSPSRAQQPPDAPEPAAQVQTAQVQTGQVQTTQVQTGQVPASSFTGLRRYEVGFDTADIRTFCVGQKDCYLPAFSLGIGAAVNLTPHFAFDTSLNVTARSGSAGTDIAGGRTTEALAGMRGELRARRYGYYAKIEPGFVYWGSVINVTGHPTSDKFFFRYDGRTRFVTDIAGGMEYSLTPSIRVRGEIGDLLMRYTTTRWFNDLQPMVGVYVGLGRPIAWNPPVYDAAAAHPFFDAANIVLLTASVLGTTADAITTQRGLGQGRGEADPIARPLVKYGWSGQISLEALETGGEIAGMYGLHRTGHHWVERAVPVCLAITHAIFAYQNASTNRGALAASR
jgi:hypothetical protein